MKKIVVGITGSTGTILGIRLLEILSGTNVETHLIISKWGQQTLEHEIESNPPTTGFAEDVGLNIDQDIVSTPFDQSVHL